MDKCRFSETQFEAYHSRQFERIGSFNSGGPQFFPTRNEEGLLAVDMVQFGPFSNWFFQYKVPKVLNSKFTDVFSGDVFRMDIYNKIGVKSNSQYKTLWEWSLTEPNVYYSTPEFYTQKDFADRYQNLIKHSAHFNLRDLINPATAGFDEENHYIYYDAFLNYGRMCSKEPVEVKKSVFFDDENLISETKIHQNLFEYSESIKERIFSIFEKHNYSLNNKYNSEIYNLCTTKTDDLHYSIAVSNILLKSVLNLEWIISPIKKIKN